ncbi:MAG: HK97 gp10 family phage protein [Alistipes indistinctus]
MAMKCTNWHEVELAFARAKEEYDRKAVEWLSVLGERVVKYAREHGSYTDRTGNLRNSIGYVVVQYGRIVTEDFSIGSGHGEAKAQARAYALEVARNLPANKTYLVWVAGKEYAKYVEAKGFDVLEGSGNWVESTAEKLKAEFARFLKSKKR